MSTPHPATATREELLSMLTDAALHILYLEHRIGEYQNVIDLANKAAYIKAATEAARELERDKRYLEIRRVGAQSLAKKAESSRMRDKRRKDKKRNASRPAN